MYKLTFYVPTSHVDSVKASLFEAGGGRVGHYEHCCWQVLGQGQFRPTEGSQPYLGECYQLTSVDEYRVELVCSGAFIRSVVAALKLSHPYEEPAYDVLQIIDM